MTQRAEDILPRHEPLPDDLYRRLVYFVDTYCLRHERQYRYGWGHLLFACYAAFPAHLSPDLLHKLRLNFRHYQQTPVPDEWTENPKKRKKPEPREIPLVAVSDLLLSNLLRETGFERFEMPEELRHYLLWLLQRSHFFEKTCKVSVLPANEDPHGQSPETFRLNGIAEFLKRYANEHYTAADNLTRSLQDAQKWAAEAWQDPKTAANVLRERLAASAKPTDLYHYSRLGNRLGVQYDLRLNLAQQKAPTEFEPLRRYAQGVSALYTGKAEQAIALLGDTDQLIATDYATTPPAGAVRLPIPREVATTLLKQHPELLEKKSGLKPRNWQSLEARLRSPWPKAVLTIDDGDRPAIAQKLVRLENELQSAYQDPTLRLADYFDIVAGSGMGAFMAAMVVQGKTASEIAFLETAMPPFNTPLEPTVFREYFQDLRFLNKEFRNGLLVALENTASNELNLAGNFSAPNTLSANNLGDLLTLANRLEVELFSSGPEAPMRSAYVLPTNSLNLATVDALLEHQQNFGWNINPEQFLLVSIQEDLGTDPIREQTRWIERHHLDLLSKHRMLVSQSNGEMQVAWPEAWRVENLEAKIRPAKVFISYSRADQVYLDDLRKWLRVFEIRGMVEIWYDGMIEAGSEWDEVIKENLQSADVILLLLSADFLASDYIYDVELKIAVERHMQGETTVVPIIIRHCDWQSFDGAYLQVIQERVLPEGGKPVASTTDWSNKEEAWQSVSRGLEALWKERGYPEKSQKPDAVEPIEQWNLPNTPKTMLLAVQEDQSYLDLTIKHLSPLRRANIALFSVPLLDAGIPEDPLEFAEKTLAETNLILVLLSVNFISDTRWFEFVQAAVRSKRKVVLIRIHNIDLKGTGLEHLPTIPESGSAIQAYPESDFAYTEIARDLKRLLDRSSGAQTIDEPLTV